MYTYNVYIYIYIYIYFIIIYYDYTYLLTGTLPLSDYARFVPEFAKNQTPQYDFNPLSDHYTYRMRALNLTGSRLEISRRNVRRVQAICRSSPV